MHLCTTDFHGLQRHSCLTTAFTTGCRETSALPHAAPPPPPSALTLELAELFRLHVLTPLLWLQLHLHNNFYSFLNVLSQKLSYHHCLAWLWTEMPAGIGSVGDGGSFYQLVKEAIPVASPHCFQNLAIQTQYKGKF